MSKLRAGRLCAFLAAIMICSAAAMTSCGRAENTAGEASAGSHERQAGVPVSAKSEVKGIIRNLPTTTPAETAPEETSPPEETEPEVTTVPEETVTVSPEVTTVPPTETKTGTTRRTTTRRTTTTKKTTAKKTTTTKKTTTKKTTTTRSETKPPETATTAVTTTAETTVTTKMTLKLPTAEDIVESLRLPMKLKQKLLVGRRFTAEKFPEYVYSNRKVKSALDEIDKICSEYDGTISFAYYNTDTKTLCMYRPDIYYGSCSTIKAPYAAAVLENGADLDEVLTVDQLWYYDGGRIAMGGVGRQYTARLLLKYSITHSDNTAYLTLVNRYGRDIFNKMNDKAGADYHLTGVEIFTPVTTRQLLKQYIYIYEQSLKNKSIAWLTRLMQKTDVEEQITEQLEEKYAVAHKYGSDSSQVCYHDCAICYADSPFILVIMTRQMPEIPSSDKVFKRLAEQFDILNEQLICI